MNGIDLTRKWTVIDGHLVDMDSFDLWRDLPIREMGWNEHSAYLSIRWNNGDHTEVWLPTMGDLNEPVRFDNGSGPCDGAWMYSPKYPEWQTGQLVFRVPDGPNFTLRAIGWAPSHECLTLYLPRLDGDKRIIHVHWHGCPDQHCVDAQRTVFLTAKHHAEAERLLWVHPDEIKGARHRGGDFENLPTKSFTLLDFAQEAAG